MKYAAFVNHQQTERKLKMKYAALVIFIGIAVIVIGPLAILWALNTLFPALDIPYTFWTWCAAFLLSAPFVNRNK